MDTRPDAALTRAVRGNLVGQAMVTRRQRAGLVTLLLVAGLHAWLLLQWSGLAAAGWSRAWPVATAHRTVMEVASVQSVQSMQSAMRGNVSAAAAAGADAEAAADARTAAGDGSPRRAAAESDRPLPARPATRTVLAPKQSGLQVPAQPVEALAALTPRAAVPIAATSGRAKSAEAVDEPIEEPTNSPTDSHTNEPTSARGAEGTLPSAPLPLYATRMPAPTRLRYAAQMGQRKGQAELDWQHDGQHYRLQLDVAAPGGPAWQQTSSGAFDAAGLAPQRFVDRRGRRAERAANFQREAGRISFSGPAVEYPLLDGAQDRLGFIVQLAAIASAASAASAAGQVPAQVALFVVDARGLGDVWTFVNQGAASVDGPLGALPSVYLLREAQRLNDWRVEAWLDPQRGFWPARLRMTVARSGAVFELTLAQEPQSP